MPEVDRRNCCPDCGEPLPEAGPRCPCCGRSLLVDVLVRDARLATDERLRFQVARTVSALGPPAPDFSEARRRLAEPAPQRPVRRVSPAFARRVVEELGAIGIAGAAEEGLSAEAAPRRSRVPPLAAAALLLVALAGAGFALLRPRPPPAPVVLAPPASAPQPPEPKRPSVEKLLASAATIRCEERVGSGFFVDEETLLTNAHVICPNAAALTVRLRDGRELLGLPLKSDPWRDFATLRVTGAAATPLPIGETAALEPGAPISFVGSPHGLEFSLHEGKVSFVGRNHFGVAYVQINATVNPGNSGGPLLNARGEVVGLVTLKVTDAEGIGLALPIEYALPPQAPEAADRWAAILRTVAEEDGREVEAYRKRYEQPRLAGVETDASGAPFAIVLQLRAGARFDPTPLLFTLQTPRGRCSLGSEVETWVHVEDSLGRIQDDRSVEWLVRSGAASDLYAGAAPLRFDRCAAGVIAVPGTLTLDGEVDRKGPPVRFHARVDGAGRGGASEAREAAPAQSPREKARLDDLDRVKQARLEQMRRQEEEALWRKRFREARQLIVDIQAGVKQARREVERLDSLVRSGAYKLTPKGHAAYELAKQTLSNGEADLRKAEEDLHELERQAALSAVPLEWRR